MNCKRCNSQNQSTFGAELALHVPDLRDLNVGPILMFPEVLVCLQCGFAEFTVPENEIKLLSKNVG